MVLQLPPLSQWLLLTLLEARCLLAPKRKHQEVPAPAAHAERQTLLARRLLEEMRQLHEGTPHNAIVNAPILLRQLRQGRPLVQLSQKLRTTTLKTVVVDPGERHVQLTFEGGVGRLLRNNDG